MQPPPSTPRPPTTASGPSTPVLPPNTHPLRCVSLRTRPNGRRLELDHRDGVKTWAVRLASHESSVHVGGVKFLVQADEVEESSDEEDVQMMEAGLAEAEEEEEEEEDVGEDSKDKGKDMATEENSKRGRGRPRKNPLNAASASPKPSKGKEPAVAKVTTPHIEVQVRLNGVVKISGEGKEEWDVDLPVGSNVLEVGEKGGVVWRVYLERLAW